MDTVLLVKRPRAFRYARQSLTILALFLGPDVALLRAGSEDNISSVVHMSDLGKRYFKKLPPFS
jgi:hypothetical protein